MLLRCLFSVICYNQAVALGKKLTPAELLKLRMRHMMAATVQKDKCDTLKDSIELMLYDKLGPPAVFLAHVHALRPGLLTA